MACMAKRIASHSCASMSRCASWQVDRRGRLNYSSLIQGKAKSHHIVDTVPRSALSSAANQSRVVANQDQLPTKFFWHSVHLSRNRLVPLLWLRRCVFQTCAHDQSNHSNRMKRCDLGQSYLNKVDRSGRGLSSFPLTLS